MKTKLTDKTKALMGIAAKYDATDTEIFEDISAALQAWHITLVNGVWTNIHNLMDSSKSNLPEVLKKYPKSQAASLFEDFEAAFEQFDASFDFLIDEFQELRKQSSGK